MPLQPWEVYERKFYHFGRLPPEVQNMIWLIAIYDVKPRIVMVKERSIPCTRRSTYFHRREFISTYPIPGVLQACRTSRSLALRRWRLSFAASHQPAKIFFDFSCDILFIPKDTRLGDFAKRLNPVDRIRLNRIAITIGDLSNNDYAENGFDLALFLMKKFPSLTHLTFPEVNLDAVLAEEAGRCAAQRRLGRSNPLGSRRRLSQLKPNPRMMVIQWYEANLALPAGLSLPIIPWQVDTWILMIGRGYRSLRYPCPEMKRVDYGTLDLGLIEYDEDQRRLDRAERRRYVEEVWQQVETQRPVRTESHSAT